ncbi:MAG: Asp-tRNA(Asn)/Glu-tRNA(Gln) amidotransferase subunit GatC [Hyphomicrobiaceae bacterium]
MDVDDKTVRRIAQLARIAVSEEEVQELRTELSGILAWVEQLDEVDTTAVEPLTRIVPIELKMRPDVVDDGNAIDAVIENAPLCQNNYFVVPKVVE